jgi:hypothetical protein
MNEAGVVVGEPQLLDSDGEGGYDTEIPGLVARNLIGSGSSPPYRSGRRTGYRYHPGMGQRRRRIKGGLSSKWTENLGKPERYGERSTYVLRL